MGCVGTRAGVVLKMTTVVHFKKAPYDVYIGRPSTGGHEHFGNPFTHKEGTRAKLVMPTRKEAIEAFGEWLEGVSHPDVNPEQRAWILAHLEDLRGKRLGCWCAPLACHGHVLARIVDGPEIEVVEPALDQMNLF